MFLQIDTSADYFYWKVVASAILICFLIAKYQARPMKMYYNSKDKLMKEFIEKTNIKNMIFRPFFLCLTPFSQTAMVLLVENIQKSIWKNNTEIELFITPDGGTLAVEWSIDNGVGKPPTTAEEVSYRKPILLVAPGLQNESDLTQTREMWWAAQKQGYKVGTILMRNAVGLPITSNKLNYNSAWPDLKVILEAVFEKYILDRKTGTKKTTFYCYGVSQGGSILGQYLGNESYRAEAILDGAILYGAPWDIPK